MSWNYRVVSSLRSYKDILSFLKAAYSEMQNGDIIRYDTVYISGVHLLFLCFKLISFNTSEYNHYGNSENASCSGEYIRVYIGENFIADSHITIGNASAKGLYIYTPNSCRITVGVNMTAKGYPGPGADICLLDNELYGRHVIPAIGAAGGAGQRDYNGGDGKWGKNGASGSAGSNRQTGGGGSGVARGGTNREWGISGSGSAGTSFSGGNGGGAGCYAPGSSATVWRGGTGAGANPHNWASGGTGNSSGGFSGYGINGNTGAGGLIVIFCKDFFNQGVIQACGVASSIPTLAYHRNAPGGASGGGSINIFYQGSYINWGNITAAGGAAKHMTGVYDTHLWSGAGGSGSVTSTYYEEDFRRYLVFDMSVKSYVNNKWNII